MHEDRAAQAVSPRSPPRSPVIAGPAAGDRRAWRDRLVLGVAGCIFRGLEAGRVTLVLPSGAAATYSGARTGSNVRVSLRDYRALWQVLSRGKLGLAEGYMDGRIEIDDLAAFFRVVLDNERLAERMTGMLPVARRHDRRFHASRANTRDGSRRNIAAHYDLGNAFYRLWLDPGMTYSSGIHAGPETSLEAAQAAKIELVLEALDLAPGQTLLEIGCGWGSFVEAAARRGARVSGLTISAEQLSWGEARIARAGLAERAEVRFEDYRDSSGTFDRLASIEMIEAVGEAGWPDYFRVLSDRLAPGGIGVIQAITIPEHLFDGYRATPDFIQRYVFPGGMLPTIDAMRRHAEAHGLVFSTIDRFGASYALTLRAWRERFHAAWPRIRELGFDERFRRMWDYYLVYCAVGFERGVVDVGLYRVAKPRDAKPRDAKPRDAKPRDAKP